MKIKSFWKSAILSTFLLFLFTSPCHAIDVTLEWDIHPDTNVTQYEVHYDTNSGEPYTGVDAEDSIGNPLPSPITVTGRSNNSITLYNLSDTDSYYFAVTASFDGGESSAYSREICALGSSSIEPGYDKGWSITSGDLEGFSVMYNSITDPNVTPTLGSSNAIPPIPNVDSVGLPLNLEVQPPQPPGWTFTTPVKIFIPCPTHPDVSGLNIYYWDGGDWILANDADDSDTVQPGAESWMVEGSRDNTKTYAVGVELYHFSGVQAGTSSSSSGSSGGGGGGGGCFIASAAE